MFSISFKVSHLGGNSPL